VKLKPRAAAAGQASAEGGLAGRVDVVHLKDDAIEIETNARILDLRARAVLAASIETAAEYRRLPNGQNVTEAQQMSQLGHKRRSRAERLMSDLPSTADLYGFPNLFAFGPKPERMRCSNRFRKSKIGHPPHRLRLQAAHLNPPEVRSP
jgi:hypothetical protein